MISVEEARERILGVIERLQAEDKSLVAALGQVLARDIVSAVTIPPLDNTSMDGYAVRAADTDGASTANPVSLHVIGEVAAGYIFAGEVTAGTAVRIMTGAPIPRGADAVVPFEETDEAPGRVFGSFAKGRLDVGVFKPAVPGANLRRAGEDVRSGSLVLTAGTQLTPAHLGVIASLGINRVSVFRRPVVAVISTGDELLAPGETLAPGQIYDSNGASVAAMVEEAGGIPLRLGIARDTVADLTRKLQAAARDADLIVTSAGVSRGDYDVVKDVLEREGEIGFWTVRMRPGKPLAFGLIKVHDKSVPHIGLPGNPVSSMVTFELFGRPAVFKMMGKTGWQRPQVRATLGERLVNPDPRRFYARAIVSHQDNGGFVARLTGPQGSGILTSMALANALVICPEDVAVIEAGAEADALLLGPLSDA